MRKSVPEEVEERKANPENPEEFIIVEAKFDDRKGLIEEEEVRASQEIYLKGYWFN